MADTQVSTGEESEDVVEHTPGPSTTLPASDAATTAPVVAPEDVLAQGLVGLFYPVVQKIDAHVNAVHESQANLRLQIDYLQQEISKFDTLPQVAEDLDTYHKKLVHARKRMQALNSLLSSSQDRVKNLKVSIAKAAKKKQKELDASQAHQAARDAKEQKEAK